MEIIRQLERVDSLHPLRPCSQFQPLTKYQLQNVKTNCPVPYSETVNSFVQRWTSHKDFTTPWLMLICCGLNHHLRVPEFVFIKSTLLFLDSASTFGETTSCQALSYYQNECGTVSAMQGVLKTTDEQTIHATVQIKTTIKIHPKCDRNPGESSIDILWGLCLTSLG